MFPWSSKEMMEMYNEIVSELLSFGDREKLYYFETDYVTSFMDESLLAPYLQKVRDKYGVWIKSLPTLYQEKEQIRLVISNNGDNEDNVKLVVLNSLAFLKELLSA